MLYFGTCWLRMTALRARPSGMHLLCRYHVACMYAGRLGWPQGTAAGVQMMCRQPKATFTIASHGTEH